MLHMLHWCRKQIKIAQENKTTYMFTSCRGSWPTGTEIKCRVCRLGGRQSSLGKKYQPRCTHWARPSLSTSPFLEPTTHSTSAKPGEINKHVTCSPSPSHSRTLTVSSPGLHTHCCQLLFCRHSSDCAISLLNNIQQFLTSYWKKPQCLACDTGCHFLGPAEPGLPGWVPGAWSALQASQEGGSG